jgi:DNA (cytosine-5)-methyltransferase 1
VFIIMKRKLLRHVDCFAGVGGIATGFHAAGIETILAIEKVSSCVDTYRANHPNTEVVNSDIRLVKNDKILEVCGTDVDIVTAGMPCETFSTAGKTSRSFYDNRQTLFSEAIRISNIVNAKVILFENVPGFANKKIVKGGERLVIDLLRNELRDFGYKNIFEVVLNSKNFGIPQSRERIFVLATKDEKIKFSPPHSKFNPVTVGEAFANLPLVDTVGPKHSHQFQRVTNHYCKLMADYKFWKIKKSNSCSYQKSPNHRERTVQRFKMIQTGEGLKSLFDRHSEDEIKQLQEQRILPKKWYIQRNRRLDSDEVSPTVTSHCIDELLHPNLHRAITVREAARLQSFPDAYNFVGGPEICPHIYETQDKYEQIGDAVPPIMAYHWASYLKELLNDDFGVRYKETNRSMHRAL